MNQELNNLIAAALECSYFLAPNDPGLAHDEIQEFGRRLNYQPGEISDAMRQVVGPSVLGSKRWHPNQHTKDLWIHFMPEEPELRNFAAFDFVVAALNSSVKAVGQRSAKVDQEVVIERAAANDPPISRHDMEVAFLILLETGRLQKKDNAIQFAGQAGVQNLPSGTWSDRHPRFIKARADALPIVKDIIERRTDGRPRRAEPFEAFSQALETLGYGHFRLWWKQIVAEMQRSDPNLTPVSTVVLSAALVEGALAFVVKHARTLELPVFKSSDFERSPRTWKIDDLVASAAAGGADTILDTATRARADILIRNRQRIHAGRMLSDFPSGVPDLRIEEASEARGTAQQVVRCILDWLEKHPATP